jgi:predicted metal-dependent hydrolase
MNANGTPPGWDEEIGAAVTIRVSRRARRIALRVRTAGRGVELVLPRGVPKKLGLGFLEQKRGWIAAQIDALPRPVPFAEGATIPVFGVPHRIRREGDPEASPKTPPRASKVAIAEGEIRVRGDEAGIARLVRRHLIMLARSELAGRARACAARLGREVKRVGVRDTRSRWGSCSAAGNLSFCWRLVLAPQSVIDYVVAHEVAHLVEMNHGPRFWQLVDSLHPGRAAARAWLREHRAELLSYGVPAGERENGRVAPWVGAYHASNSESVPIGTIFGGCISAPAARRARGQHR